MLLADYPKYLIEQDLSMLALAVFEAETWTRLPWGFWAVMYFVFGSMVGSFLNVCIYRLPRDLSVVHPPSHCPKCEYRIPFYLNMPIVTWLVLGGKCGNCREKISPQYIIVEILTGGIFLGMWYRFGVVDQLWSSHLMVLVASMFLSGLLVATWVDFEHYIIPDSITLGGIVVGFFLSFGVPEIHFMESRVDAMIDSLLGIILGWGMLYSVLRLGKMAFGKKKITFPDGTRLQFSDTGIKTMGEEGDETPYQDIFYRESDQLRMSATRVELPDRCYFDTEVVLMPSKLTIGKEEWNPEDVPGMEVETREIIQPQEAMGFGDVKFMGAIGAFLGWKAVLFTITISSIIGSLIGVLLIVTGNRQWSSRIPFGPYISVAATLYLLGGRNWMVKYLETGQIWPF